MGRTKFIPPGPHSTSGAVIFTGHIRSNSSQPGLVFDRTPKEHPSEIVDYEIRMFRFTYREVMRLHSEAEQKDLCNALFESYLIHYRGLVELFIARRREDGRPNLRDEDLSITRARSWFGRDLTAEEIEALDTDAIKLRTLHNRIGKYLAHLSEPRATDGMTWAVPEMHELLDALVTRLMALREHAR